MILGTSAGSVVGALAASRTDVAAVRARMAAVAELVGAEQLAAGFQNFMTAIWQADPETDPEQGLRSIAKAAEGTKTIDEQAYLGLYEAFAGLPPPGAHHCTAVDAETGALVVWGPGSGVPLQIAVASGCAVPMIHPTVTLRGRRYIDGGIANHLNPAAAPRTDRWEEDGPVDARDPQAAPEAYALGPAPGRSRTRPSHRRVDRQTPTGRTRPEPWRRA